MTVEELIKELKNFPPKMEVVDSDGDLINFLRYKRIYDSQYPYKEIEHLSLCLDCDKSLRRMKIEELKDIIKCQQYDYPDMYVNDKNIESLLELDKSNDVLMVYTEWEYAGVNERNKPIFKLKYWHPYY